MESGQRRPNAPVATAVPRRRTVVIDALAGLYAAVLVSATHYPRPQDLLGAHPPSDKLLHFLAYCLLGGLAAAAAAARGGWNGPRITLLAVALAVFAAADEITQPFFGRAVEFPDWLADLAGIAVGIGAVVLWTARPTLPATAPAGEAPGQSAGESRF
jgi:VanZ family protein